MAVIRNTTMNFNYVFIILVQKTTFKDKIFGSRHTGVKQKNMQRHVVAY